MILNHWLIGTHEWSSPFTHLQLLATRLLSTSTSRQSELLVDFAAKSILEAEMVCHFDKVGLEQLVSLSLTGAFGPVFSKHRDLSLSFKVLSSV